MKITLKKASMQDAMLLWNWANDATVRQNSFHQEPIPYEEHVAWLKRRLDLPDCLIYMGEEKGKPVGQIRLDREAGGRAYIDYSVEKTCRGQGYGTALVAALEALLKKAPEGKGIERLCAKVKPDNAASGRVFEKCGFIKSVETADYVEYEKRLESPGKTEKRRIIICTHKSWNVENARKFLKETADCLEVKILTEKEALTVENLERFSPEYVFFPHWSYIIPAPIYEKYTCVVFHMTDLPFGRGGSPLQNLIVRGFEQTKVSAIRVDAGLDTGPVYMKEDLELSGTAEEILKRTSALIFTRMIPGILEKNPVPKPQEGEVVTFKRRKEEDGRLCKDMEEKTMYDYIRMLDAEGYPHAYAEFGPYKIRFSQAEYREGKLTAKAEFVRKEE